MAETPPTLTAYEGQRTNEAVRWDAAAEKATADFIRRHLAEHPAPAGSALRVSQRRSDFIPLVSVDPGAGQEPAGQLRRNFE